MALSSLSAKIFFKQQNNTCYKHISHLVGHIKQKSKFVLFTYLCNEIWVADNCSDEEAVVRNFSTLLNTSSSQVEVHLVVGAGNSCQVKVPHSVELQLKGQSWLQIPVNTIFLELKGSTDSVIVSLEMTCQLWKCRLFKNTYPVSSSECEELGEFSLFKWKFKTIIRLQPFKVKVACKDFPNGKWNENGKTQTIGFSQGKYPPQILILWKVICEWN